MDWASADHVDGALAALRETVKELDACDDAIDLAETRARVRELVAQLGPDAESALREMAGIGDGGLPGKLALINSVMDALPDEMAEYILANYMNQTFA